MKPIQSQRRLTAALLSLLLCLCAVLPALAEQPMHDELQAALAQTAKNVLLLGDSDLSMYQNMKRPNVAKAMPERFDLRDLGVVPEVRSQGKWGTCWGFASISACETSILSKLDMTSAEFLDKYGREMNLSEKHLAWFGAGHLPEPNDDAHSAYIYPGLETQAGEGVYQRDTEAMGPNARYNGGGFMAFASSVFAAGMGPVYESMAPYEAADGTQSTAADWSLDDSLRFGLSFELENSSILPSPALRDSDGNYVYNAFGTEAIKSELLNGRSVTIAYHADVAMDPKARETRIRDRLAPLKLADDQIALVLAINNGEITMEDVQAEDITAVMKAFLFLSGVDLQVLEDDESLMQLIEEHWNQQDAASEETDPDAAAAEQAAIEQAARAKAEELGLDYDQYSILAERVAAANQEVYINTDTYAQYTDNKYATPTHAVTVVGWDDAYPASSFVADHQPPADGAWIVRNSWGSNYGIDGYFYLSYYDQSLVGPETFDFMVSDMEKRTSAVDIMSHDYMQTPVVNSIQMKETTSIANVFQVESDSVLSYVSILTADLNTSVTVVVCLLNENAATPIDGTVLDVVTSDIMYGGYHRLALSHNYAVPAGSSVSIVQLQRADTTEGMIYAVPYTIGTNRKYMEAHNTFEKNAALQSLTWIEGRIGKGESYIYQDGAWVDWSDVIAELQSACKAAGYLSYDNLNMKLYAYPLSEIEAMHQLEEPIAFNGANAQICLDCGYTIVEQ